MSVFKKFALLTPVLILTAHGSAAHAERVKCPFTYNQEIARKLVLPKLKEVYGKNYTLYSLDDPGIIMTDKDVELIFGQGRTDVLDTPNFVVRINRCSLRVTKAYETSPFPSDAPPHN